MSSELEQARPQTSGEEELQLQLALAMSREVAEQVSVCGGGGHTARSGDRWTVLAVSVVLSPTCLPLCWPARPHAGAVGQAVVRVVWGEKAR